MKFFLKYLGIWDVVEKGYTKPDAGRALTTEQVRAQKQNNQALHHLFQCVELNVFQKLINCRQTKEAWEIC